MRDGKLRPVMTSTVAAIRRRVAAIERNREVEVPEMSWRLTLTQAMTREKVLLGRFESPEQSIAFALCGAVLRGDIELTSLPISKSRMLSLNEEQVTMILLTKRITVFYQGLPHELALEETVLGTVFEVEEQ